MEILQALWWIIKLPFRHWLGFLFLFILIIYLLFYFGAKPREIHRADVSTSQSQVR